MEKGDELPPSLHLENASGQREKVQGQEDGPQARARSSTLQGTVIRPRPRKRVDMQGASARGRGRPGVVPTVPPAPEHLSSVVRQARSSGQSRGHEGEG